MYRNVLLILIVVLLLLITYLLKCPQYITIFWTIILVIITGLYSYSSFQIHNLQKKSQILNYFIQTNIRNIKYDLMGSPIDTLEFNLNNLSNTIGYDAKLRIFDGDSIVKIKNEDDVLDELFIGILEPNSSNPIKISFLDPISINSYKKLRFELRVFNLLKVENNQYYLLLFHHNKAGILDYEIKLIDFNNGVNKANLKRVRDISI